MEILVQNKQRKHKIALSSMEAMANELAKALFVNFKKRKLKTQWVTHLQEIEKYSTLSLLIVSPRAIKELNKDWRGKDKETDVLSFPLLDFCNPNISQELHLLKKLSGNTFELGEIFISYEQAQKQAKEYTHSLERELAFLFVHGLLHIFGFDHQNKNDEKEMFARQREILNEAGYFR